MKKKNRLPIITAISATIVILTLVFLLVMIESKSSDASIHSFFDGIWFLMCTITTVGYGDLYPVTFSGKIIGLIFVLISAGLFTLMISFFLSVMLGKLPLLLLRFRKNKQWIIFTELNAKTFHVAEDLKSHDESRIILFLAKETGEYRSTEHDFLFLDTSLDQIFRLKGPYTDRDSLLVFVMNEEVVKNYTIANEICTRFPQVKCYCETTYQSDLSKAADLRNDSLFIFNCYDLNARNYWKKHPIRKGEKNVILIGDGDYAQNIVSRAFLGNIFGKTRRVRYHIFGDYEKYLLLHRHLSDMVNILEINTGMLSITENVSAKENLQSNLSDEKDSFLFYKGSLLSEVSLLKDADRIVICHDDDFQNQKILSSLNQYYATQGMIHVKSSSEEISSTYFGNIHSLFSEKTIVDHEQDKLAHELHDAYVAKKKESGESYKEWQDLELILKLQNIVAADHLLTKAQILLDEPVTELTREVAQKAYACFQEKQTLYQEIEHERWMRFFCFYNFQYGVEKNFAQHTHPNYVAFEELSEDTKSYDDNEWKLLNNIQ